MVLDKLQEHGTMGVIVLSYKIFGNRQVPSESWGRLYLSIENLLADDLIVKLEGGFALGQPLRGESHEP